MSEKIEALKAERDELIATHASATSWGAALGARQERINEIEREILRRDRAARIPEPDDEAMVEIIARAIHANLLTDWIWEELPQNNRDYHFDEARAVLAALREAGALK